MSCRDFEEECSARCLGYDVLVGRRIDGPYSGMAQLDLLDHLDFWKVKHCSDRDVSIKRAEEIGLIT